MKINFLVWSIVLLSIVNCSTPKNIANKRIPYNTSNLKVASVRSNLIGSKTVRFVNGVKVRNVPLCMFPFDSLKIIDYRGKYYWVD